MHLDLKKGDRNSGQSEDASVINTIMRKISKMYEWSGGTDWTHVCKECKNCQKFQKGNRSVYKCLIYGNTDSEASDWKASYIACKKFNADYTGTPIIELVKRQPKKKNEEIEGQMRIEDFIKGA